MGNEVNGANGPSREEQMAQNQQFLAQQRQMQQDQQWMTMEMNKLQNEQANNNMKNQAITTMTKAREDGIKAVIQNLKS